MSDAAQDAKNDPQMLQKAIDKVNQFPGARAFVPLRSALMAKRKLAYGTPGPTSLADSERMQNQTLAEATDLGELPGNGQYETLDPRWIGCFFEYIKSTRCVFPVHTAGNTGVHELVAEEEIRIAMVGDWGTGIEPASSTIPSHIAALKPHYAIHIGDTYYCGDHDEVRRNFLDNWKMGASKGSFALNGNHEMYSGGDGFFNVLLANESFKQQGVISIP